MRQTWEVGQGSREQGCIQVGVGSIVMGGMAPSDGGGLGHDWKCTLHFASEGEGDLGQESVVEGWGIVKGPGALEAMQLPGCDAECPCWSPA